VRTDRVIVLAVALALACLAVTPVFAAMQYTHTLSLVRGESVFVECSRNALSMSRLPDPSLAVVLVCYDDKPGLTPPNGAQAVKWKSDND
jgi:hypothetical protein